MPTANRVLIFVFLAYLIPHQHSLFMLSPFRFHYKEESTLPDGINMYPLCITCSWCQTDMVKRIVGGKNYGEIEKNVHAFSLAVGFWDWETSVPLKKIPTYSSHYGTFPSHFLHQRGKQSVPTTLSIKLV